jgi:hypothetical protein
MDKTDDSNNRSLSIPELPFALSPGDIAKSTLPNAPRRIDYA